MERAERIDKKIVFNGETGLWFRLPKIGGPGNWNWTRWVPDVENFPWDLWTKLAWSSTQSLFWYVNNGKEEGYSMLMIWHDFDRLQTHSKQVEAIDKSANIFLHGCNAYITATEGSCGRTRLSVNFSRDDMSSEKNVQLPTTLSKVELEEIDNRTLDMVFINGWLYRLLNCVVWASANDEAI